MVVVAPSELFLRVGVLVRLPRDRNRLLRSSSLRDFGAACAGMHVLAAQIRLRNSAAGTADDAHERQRIPCVSEAHERFLSDSKKQFPIQMTRLMMFIFDPPHCWKSFVTAHKAEAAEMPPRVEPHAISATV